MSLPVNLALTAIALSLASWALLAGAIGSFRRSRREPATHRLLPTAFVDFGGWVRPAGKAKAAAPVTELERQRAAKISVLLARPGMTGRCVCDQCIADFWRPLTLRRWWWEQ